MTLKERLETEKILVALCEKPTVAKLRHLMEGKNYPQEALNRFLSACSELDSPKAAAHMLALGADRLAHDPSRRIALHHAHSEEMMTLLLAEKAQEQIMTKDRWGRTPFEHMKDHKAEHVADMLAKHMKPEDVAHFSQKPTRVPQDMYYPEAFFKNIRSLRKGRG